MKNAIIILLLTVLLVYGLSTLIFWGLGNFIIWVFKINYDWTLFHGLVTTFIYQILKEIFKK